MALVLPITISAQILTTSDSDSDLHFSSLATKWDEAMPLGNATLGALVSFENLRARGALLISAYKSNGTIKKVVIVAEKGGKVRMKDTALQPVSILKKRQIELFLSP